MKTGKNKFLLLVPYTYPEYAGSGINAMNFSKFLLSEGIRSTLLSFNRNGKYRRKESIEGVEIRRILYLNRNLVCKILSLFIIIPNYIFFIMRNQIILIYGGHLIGWELVILIAKWLNRKIIFQSLLVDTDDIETIIQNKKRILGRFYQKLFNKVDVYHSINPIFSERFRNVTGRSDAVLEMPQGVDISVFRQVTNEIKMRSRKQLHIQEDEFVLLSIGFMIPRKGFSELFEGLKNLAIRFRFIVAGEYDFPPGHFLSSYSDASVELVNKGKSLLGDKLVLAGPVKNIENYFYASDIVIFNSVQEGLPNSLLEAMSCGIPVLTGNIPGLEGFILKNQENCIIFNDKDELAYYVTYLHDNKGKAEKLGTGSVKYIQLTSSFRKILSAYLQRLDLNEIGTDQ